MKDGKYKGRVVGNVVLGTSKAKGTPFIEFYGEIVGGEFSGERARYTGYFSESNPKVVKRTIESLQICGWDGSDLSDFSDGELHGLDTNEVEFVVENESYEITTDSGSLETRTSPRIQWINRPGAGGRLSVDSAMKPDAAKAFGERMKGLVLKVGAANTRPSNDEDFAHGANLAKTGTRQF